MIQLAALHTCTYLRVSACCNLHMQSPPPPYGLMELAKNKPAFSSSAYLASYSAAKAVDDNVAIPCTGSSSTMFSSAGEGIADPWW